MLNIKIENNDFDNFEKYIEENKINIEEIEKIELINCKKIKNLPKINNLKELIINECDNLELPIECINIEKLIIYEKDYKKDYEISREEHKYNNDDNKNYCDNYNYEYVTNPKIVKLHLDYPHITIIPNEYKNLKELVLYNSIIDYLPNDLINLERIILNNSYIDIVYLSKLEKLNYLKINSMCEDLTIDNRIDVLKYLKIKVLCELNNINKCYTTDLNNIKMRAILEHQKKEELYKRNNFIICYIE